MFLCFIRIQFHKHLNDEISFHPQKYNHISSLREAPALKTTSVPARTWSPHHPRKQPLTLKMDLPSSPVWVSLVAKVHFLKLCLWFPLTAESGREENQMKTAPGGPTAKTNTSTGAERSTNHRRKTSLSVPCWSCAFLQTLRCRGYVHALCRGGASEEDLKPAARETFF